MRQREVEGYKLTEGQVRFQKKFSQLKAVQRLLEDRTLAEQERTRTLRALWQELNGEFQKLQLEMPESSVQEFDGMEPGVEPSPDRNWDAGAGVQ